MNTLMFLYLYSLKKQEFSTCGPASCIEIIVLDVKTQEESTYILHAQKQI